MKIKHETRTTTFVAKRRLNINNTIIEEGDAYATITHPARVPPNKVIAGLYNGVAADLRELTGPVEEKSASDQGKSEGEPKASDAGSDSDKGGEGDPPESDVNASPAAIKFAAEHGIDLSAVKGSGSNDKITKPDVEKLVNANA